MNGGADHIAVHVDDHVNVNEVLRKKTEGPTRDGPALLFHGAPRGEFG